MAPGVSTELHSPVASENNRDQQTVTLYFRYGKEPLLASESRTLTVSQNEPAEKAVVQALLDGPGTGMAELRRLFPEQVEVLNTVAQGDLLFVTFNGALLRAYSDEPGDWNSQDAWREEVPLRRRLAMQSLVASITENFSYQSVQVLVQQRGEVSTSMRLENSYYQNNKMKNGLADPLTRDETLLLTANNTARVILTSWQQKDWGRLYLYISSRDPDTGKDRPSQDTAYTQWDRVASIADYTISGGSVSHDGSRAVVCVDGSLARGEEEAVTFSAYPLHLSRGDGIWKITYEQLSALMRLFDNDGGAS